MASAHLSDEDLAQLALTGEENAHVTSCAACSAEATAFRVLIERLKALPEPPERLLTAATGFYRRRRKIEELLERLTEDAAFRAKARSSPEKVLHEFGLEADPELVEVLRAEGRTSGELARRLAAKQFFL
jgi:hypothetical protein